MRKDMLTVTLSAEQIKDIIDLIDVAEEDEIDFPDSIREAQATLIQALEPEDSHD